MYPANDHLIQKPKSIVSIDPFELIAGVPSGFKRLGFWGKPCCAACENSESVMKVETMPHNVVMNIKNIKNKENPEIIFENIEGL